jgi:tripartite ATP-independent transporter DctM subunit
MNGFVVVILFILLISLSMPISFCMLIVSMLYILITKQAVPTFIPLAMTSGSSTILILSIPFFILVGELMNSGGITKKIFEFADALVGHISGGLGHVNIIASLIFSGMSGAAVADVAGLGIIEIEAMTDAGYDKEFSVGITAASSTIGPIFPPSTVFVMFGILAGVSIGSLFLAGAIVGITMAIVMMFTVYIISKKKNYPTHPRVPLKVLWGSFKKTFWALLTPIILIGGIVSGQTTPTEASAVAVIYSLFLGFFVYKELTISKVVKLFKNVIENMGIVMLLIAAGTIFSWILGMEKIANGLGVVLLAFNNKIITIFLINIFLLFLGTFMVTEAALIISIPILMPIIQTINLSPITFGVAMTLNLMIGLLTPPMAICLFITSKIANIPFEKAFKATLPYYIGLLLIIALLYIFPVLTLWLPSLFYGQLSL